MFAIVTILGCTKTKNPSLSPTLYYCHTIEAPDSIYECIKGRYNLDTVCSMYHDRAILVEFELKNAGVISAQEIIYQFDNMGRLKCRIKYQSNHISKLLLGLNMQPLKISDDVLNGSFDLVFDGNKLCDSNEGRVSNVEIKK